MDWIRQLAGPFDLAPVNACGDLSHSGYCADDKSWAMYCDSDQVQQENCAAGQQCGWDAQADGFRCVDVDPCQGIDTLGRCEGDSAVWCADGELQRFNCSACGWTCDWASDATGYDCVQQIGDSNACVVSFLTSSEICLGLRPEQFFSSLLKNLCARSR